MNQVKFEKYKKAAFLDRDGVINEDSGFLYKTEDFKWIKGAIDALKILKRNNYLIIIINFSILQSIKFINTNLVAINLLAFCWIIISYILDKYSVLEDDYNIDFSNKILRSLKTFILI